MKAKHIPYLIIAGLIALLILQRECTPPCEDCGETIVKVDTVVRTRIVQKEIQTKGDEIKVTDTLEFTDTLELTRRDTVLIVQSFLDTIVQNSVWFDSTLSIDITDTLTRNHIIGRLLAYTLIQRDTTITNVVEKQRVKLMAGFNIGGGKNSFSFAPQLGLLTKRDHYYSIGSDLLTEQPNLNAGLMWKISLRKKPLRPP